MGFWSRIFKRRTNQQKTVVELVTETGNGFYSWNGKLFKSDIIRSAIRPTARAVGKLVPKHIREGMDGLKVNPDPYLRMLLEEPNPLMGNQLFQEKMATQLLLNNNAFALIVRDDFGMPVQIYPIPAVSTEAIYQNNELFLRFTLLNGKIFTFPYRDIIHLRQDFHSNDIFGESPAESLTDLMEVITTIDQGIIKAIKNSNVIKWILKFTTSLRPEDIRREVKRFTEEYLSIDAEGGGAAGVDAKADLTQVEPKSYVPDDKQMDKTIQRVYSFFNTNENIIQSKFTEDGWNAFYESVIEPIAIQLSQEFTRKIFTRRERGFGNKIIFESSNLQYASMNTKLGLMAMVDRGAMTPNEWRKVMNLGPIEGGDQPIRRLDTAPIEGGEDNGETQD
ncbi:portal protein [Caldibacillus phage CBP1]|uniref:Phage-related protein n=1 Tax=Caldibacillus debilis GB1 TaxID=1339248 RepID=A0A420VIQ2_9BACI|nr:phage portal protein [Caldibacillus debilis]ATB52727.1 portal protein [Caldibacillus phage CBP1]RKO63552.1 Phage-related protein [Caldibacillus debilis GB1]